MTLNEIITKVSFHDAEAGQYLASNEVKELTNYDADASSLISMFRWEDTPQGHPYWKHLHDMIKGEGR